MMRMIGGISGTRIMAALGTLFNILALNLVLVIASIPVLTLPAAVGAVSVALDQWRRDGEDRVVRSFVIALRSRAPLRTTAATGVPLAAAALGLVEIRHFAREATLPGRVGLGLGLGALLVTLASLGYVLQLAADDPALPPVELWSLSARLAIRNLPIAGPLSVAAIAAAAVLTVTDPGLLLLGVPVFLVYVLKLVARPGLRRVQGAQGAGPPEPAGPAALTRSS
jgi:hypothetical protein